MGGLAMSKKQYLQPTIEVVLIKIEQSLLAGSMGINETPEINIEDYIVDDSLEGIYAD